MQNKEQRQKCLIDIADRLIRDLFEEEEMTGEMHYPLIDKIITIYKIADKIKEGSD